MKRCLVLFLLIGLLTACSGGEITRTQGDVRIWLHDTDLFAGGLDGEVFGTMTYDRPTQCMYLEHGGRLLPVIWPSGTRIELRDPVTLNVKGETITAGDSVYGSGGYRDPNRFEIIPDECVGTTSEVAVFNADSRIEVTRPQP